jgi:thioesterase domain-containing protein
VSPPRRDDPIAALNQVLSEVIDAILDVGQAHRRVPETHALTAVLDQRFADLRTWAGLLADQDQALGVSPLAYMPSAAGRTPPTRWHGAASDEEVRRIVGEHLDRLGQHLATALAEQDDDTVRTALAEVERGIPGPPAGAERALTYAPPRRNNRLALWEDLVRGGSP